MMINLLFYSFFFPRILGMTSVSQKVLTFDLVLNRLMNAFSGSKFFIWQFSGLIFRQFASDMIQPSISSLRDRSHSCASSLARTAAPTRGQPGAALLSCAHHSPRSSSTLRELSCSSRCTWR